MYPEMLKKLIRQKTGVKVKDLKSIQLAHGKTMASFREILQAKRQIRSQKATQRYISEHEEALIKIQLVLTNHFKRQMGDQALFQSEVLVPLAKVLSEDEMQYLKD